MQHSQRLVVPIIVALAAGAIALLCSLVPARSASAAVPSTPAIIGGSEVATDEYAKRWPFIVALLDNTRECTKDGCTTTFWNQQDCGGSLIHPRVVLTAAHCVAYEIGNEQVVTDPDDLSVLIGTTSLATPIAGVALPAGAEHINVSRVIVHPGYCAISCSFQNDAALLYLQHAPADAQSKVIALVDPLDPLDAEAWGDGAGIGSSFAGSAFGAPLAGSAGPWIAGWGDVDAGDKVDSYPESLMSVAVPIQPDQTCNDTANEQQGGFSAVHMLCAGVSGIADSCQGDSGGPLIVWRGDSESPAADPEGESVADWRLAGVTSWGYGCADALSYGFYTRLGATAIRSFIDERGLNAAGTGPSALEDPTGVDGESFGLSSITLRWDPPASGGTPNGYNVYRHEGGTWIPAATCPGTPCTVTGLRPGMDYVFLVTSTTTDGDATYESYGSEWVRLQTLDDIVAPTAPGRPQLVARNRTSITMSWRASTDNDAIRRYDVQRWRNGRWRHVTYVTGRRHRVRSLAPGTRYSFRIRAEDRSGNAATGASGRLATRA